MLELWQAEWCPFSHSIRQRLTELGIDFVARQVPAERAERDGLRETAGTDEIPVLVAPDQEPVRGEAAILAFLDERYDERPDAGRHRAKARVDVPQFAELHGR